MRIMEEVDMANRRVLIRLDLNVPMHQGIIDSSIRIDKALPTIKLALKTASNVVIMSHLGRPKEDTFDQKYFGIVLILFLYSSEICKMKSSTNKQRKTKKSKLSTDS